MIPKFRQYDIKEGEAAGRAFVAALTARPDLNASDIPGPDWTEKIIDWWSWTKAQRAVVDAHPVRQFKGEIDVRIRDLAKPFTERYGEVMVDLAHYDFRPYSHYREADYWEQAYARDVSPELLLALESESGKLNNRVANQRMVFDDASKLVALACRVKVVIYASHGAHRRHDDTRTAILKIADLMVRQDYTFSRNEKPPVWLWIDIPWTKWTPGYGPSCRVGIAGTGLLSEK